MLKQLSLCAALCAVSPYPLSATAAEPIPQAAAPTIEKLSPAALQALVSGVALYPNPVVEQILIAAQNPLALHQAAEAQSGKLPPEVAALAAKQADESIDYLQQCPEVLKQLDEQLALTTRLGVAYRVQPDDVWTAINAVRSEYENAVAEQQSTGDESTASGDSSSGGAAAYPVYGGWVARSLLAADAIHELNQYRYDQVVAANTTTYVGPNGGTATVTGATGQATVGNTTYKGGAGTGTVTGPNGESVTVAGGAKGSVTQSGNTTQVETDAAGAYSTSTGREGYGQRSGEATVTQNADGSTSWDHNASGSGAGTNGSGNYTHSGEGTITGDGNGSYQGETTVNANGNSVTTETTAGGGNASTTVTNNNTGASNTYTAGDGQVGNSTSTQSNGSTDRKASSSSRDWSQMNRDQISQANQAMKQSWGQLGTQLQNRLGGGNASSRLFGGTNNANKRGNAQPLNTKSRSGQFNATTRGSRSTPSRSGGSRSSGGGRGGRGRR